MSKLPEEWLKQAEYDMDTANYMFKGGRYFYAVFMCHLSIEKALKGLFTKRMNEEPPKVHNLIYFLNRMNIKPPEPIGRFLVKLNEASVVTRYPEEIKELQKNFTKPVVKDFLSKNLEALKWIRTQF